MDSGQLFLVACSFALVCGQAAPECNSTKPGIVLKAGATGTLDFPLGTEDYKPNLRCYWRIVGPKNSILRYRFTQFDFEPVDYYLYDYIRIFKTTDDFYQNKNPAYEYSGDDLPKGGAWFETSANELFVVFKSDQNVEGKGFTLEWVTPVNGGFSAWSPWSGCSVSCGTGFETRSRCCSNPHPQNGGAYCKGLAEEKKECKEKDCKSGVVDGFWAAWTAWGSCSKTCGEGTKTRTRTCSNPAPSGGGRTCPGLASESATCKNADCSSTDRVDGGWTDWCNWSDCTKSCGGGTRTSSRTCTNPVPSNGGSSCTGDSLKTEMCNGKSCGGIDGGWTEWCNWSDCTKSCGGGTRTSSRSCTNPVPSNGGKYCNGEPTKNENCNEQSCGADGNWSPWSGWSACSRTCGDGTKTATRTCSNPAPSGGGRDCAGSSSKSVACKDKECMNDPPVDGGWTDWCNWSDCTKSCGGGTRTSSRTCTNPVPGNGGRYCNGEPTRTEGCNGQSCGADGNWSPWSGWSACSKTCGDGTKTATRTCSNPAPSGGGRDCAGSSSKSVACKDKECMEDPPVDGGWTDWCNWSDCTKSCGGGTRTSSRTCTNPVPSNGGRYCNGDPTQTENCNTRSCNPAVNGGWSSWCAWSDCSKTCGAGTRTSSRRCDDPVTSGGGQYCLGEHQRTIDCNEGPCTVDGSWSPWSRWGSCSRTCGDGTKSRSRTCTDPAPSSGGRFCSGSEAESAYCKERDCPLPTPVDGGWSGWTAWSGCSETCGEGKRTSSRSCNNPVPRNGGEYCEGDHTKTVACNEGRCGVNGGWSSWCAWSDCSKTCGAGTRTSSRRCDDPVPQNGGDYCSGEHIRSVECNRGSCPVDGEWGSWCAWSDCSKSCGGGSQTTARVCDNPAPGNGGEDCEGQRTMTRQCNEQPCRVDGGWSRWSHWGSCSKTCGMTGTRTRSRTCTEPVPQNGGRDCGGDSRDAGDCNEGLCPNAPVDGGWSAWDSWSACPRTCGGGIRTTRKYCDNPTPKYGGAYCVGDDSLSQSCNDMPCPVDGAWSDWASWTTCSKTCGGGSQTTTRRCDSPRPQYGGEDCPGDSSKNRRCVNEPCGVDGDWGSWCAWSDCSRTCDAGTQTRARFCDSPAPQDGGDYCEGEHKTTRDCNERPCPRPIPANWSPWSAWSVCSRSCGEGMETRTRSCTDPAPPPGGAPCPGQGEETRRCSIRECIDDSVDGNWSSWRRWSTCSASCNGGSRIRSRVCDDPRPRNGGRMCEGDDVDLQACNQQPCIVDGDWSSWSLWGSCSTTCDQGLKYRSRTCTDPAPTDGGRYCVGSSEMSAVCNERPCIREKVDGGWSSYSWTPCSRTCGGGIRTGTRTCDNPRPANGGSDCQGSAVETQACNQQLCDVRAPECQIFIDMPCSSDGDCAVLRNTRCEDRKCQCDEQTGYYHDKDSGVCRKIQLGTKCDDDGRFCSRGVTGAYCPAGVCVCRPGQTAIYGNEKPECVSPRTGTLCATCIESGGVCYDSTGNDQPDKCGCPDCAKPSDPDNSLGTGCNEYFAFPGQPCDIEGKITCADKFSECAHDGQLSLMTSCTCKIGFVMVPHPDDPDKKMCARQITREVDPDCGTCVGNGGRCYDLDNNDEMDGCLCPVTRSSPCPGPEFACTKNHVSVECSSDRLTICVMDKDDFIGDLKSLFAEGHEENLDCHFKKTKANEWCLTYDYVQRQCGLEVTDAKHAVSYAAWVMFQHKSRVVSPRDLCLYGYCTYHKLAKTSSGIIEVDMKKITTSLGHSVKPAVEMDVYNKWNQDVQVLGARIGNLVKLVIRITDDQDGVYRALRAEVCLASSMMSLDHPSVKTSIMIRDSCPVLDNALIQPSPYFTPDDQLIYTNYFPLPMFATNVVFFHCAVKVCINADDCKPKTCDADNLTRRKRQHADSGSALLKQVEEMPDAVTKTVAVFIVDGEPRLIMEETGREKKGANDVEKVMEHVITKATEDADPGQQQAYPSTALLVVSIVGTSLLGLAVIVVILVIFMRHKRRRTATVEPDYSSAC